MFKLLVSGVQFLRCWPLNSEPFDGILLLPFFIILLLPWLLNGLVHFLDFWPRFLQLFSKYLSVLFVCSVGLECLFRLSDYCIFIVVRHVWFRVIPLGQKIKQWLLYLISTEDDICLIVLVFRGSRWLNLLMLILELALLLLHWAHACLFCLFLSSRTDANGFFRHQWWHELLWRSHLFPWQVTHL